MRLSGHHSNSINIHISHSITHQCTYLILLHINFHISFCYTVQHLPSRTTKSWTPHKPEMLELKGLGKWHNRAVGDSSTWPEVKCTDSSSSLSSISASHMSLSYLYCEHRHNIALLSLRLSSQNWKWLMAGDDAVFISW